MALDFLKTGQTLTLQESQQADMSFRVDHVPALRDLEQILARLPKSQQNKVVASQKFRSHDGPANDNTIGQKNTEVRIILPSDIIRRELANPDVT